MYKGDLQNYNLFKVKTSINKKLTLFKYTFVQPNSKYKNMKRKYTNTTFNNRLVLKLMLKHVIVNPYILLYSWTCKKIKLLQKHQAFLFERQTRDSSTNKSSETLK